MVIFEEVTESIRRRRQRKFQQPPPLAIHSEEKGKKREERKKLRLAMKTVCIFSFWAHCMG
jgi:hypothetical protein